MSCDSRAITSKRKSYLRAVFCTLVPVGKMFRLGAGFKTLRNAPWAAEFPELVKEALRVAGEARGMRS